MRRSGGGVVESSGGVRDSGGSAVQGGGSVRLWRRNCMRR